MASAILTSKWQVVIPKPVREHLGVHPGNQIDFTIRDNGEVIVRPAVEDVKQLRGLLHRPSRKAVPLSRMKQVIRSRASKGLRR